MFALILQLIQLLPSVIKTIKEVETAVGTGNGAAKKAMVLAPMKVAQATPELTKAVGDMVDEIVAVHNTITKK